MNLGTVMGLVLSLAVAGCGSDNKGGNGDGGSSDLSMNGSTDFAGSSTDLAGSSTDMAGNTAPDCASVAMQSCTQLQLCTPQFFILLYENMTICKDVSTKACMAAKTAGDNGVMDPAACLTAFTSSCDSYFNAALITPAACKRKLGTVADQGPCSFDSQCGAGEYCYFTKAGCPGKCQMPFATGTSGCTVDHECDIDNGAKCVATFQAGPPPTSDGNVICQTVTYGGQGAACVDSTNMRCANGFGCANNACAAILAVGSPCDGAASALCDYRKGDSCQTDPNNVTAKICTPSHNVNVGAQCGMTGVPPVNQTCSQYALCTMGAPPTTCAARVPQGMACTVGPPDNCDPGFTCMAGTCQPPPAVTCP